MLPFVLLIHFDNNIIDNLAIFSAIMIGSWTLLIIGVSTMVPPEHAIKTEDSVVEYFKWRVNAIMANLTSLCHVFLAILLAANAEILYAVIVFFSGIASFLWLDYVDRIHMAQKDATLSALKE